MDIGDDEVVETSDIEELEELQQQARNATKTARRSYDYDSMRSDDYPRKRMKFFDGTANPPIQDLRRLSISPSKSLSVDTSSPLGSRSSSTVLNIASPSLRSALWRSPTRTPVDSQEFQHPKEVVERDNTVSELLSPVDVLSQDPLLLRSPTQRLVLPQTPTPSPLLPSPLAGSQRKLNVLGTSNHLSTPEISPPGQWHDSPALDTVSLFGPTPTATPRDIPQARVRSSSADSAFVEKMDSDDELLLFTPLFTPAKRPSPRSKSPAFSSKSLSPQIPDGSPMMDVREPTKASGSTLRESSHSSPSPPSPSPPPQPTVADDHDLALALEEESHTSRYSLRKRNIAQLNPYTVESVLYKRALRSNPEAIVKFKGLERHYHHHGKEDQYEEEEETQQNGHVNDDADDDDADWEEQERRRQRREEKKRSMLEQERTRANSDSRHLLNILSDLSDDEDDEETRALSKEAKKAVKEMERKRRLQEKEERQRQQEEQGRRARRFPTIPRHKKAPSESSTSRDRRLGAHTNDDDRLLDTNPRSSGVPSSATDVAIQDYFAEVAAYESETPSSPIRPIAQESRVPSHIPSSPGPSNQLAQLQDHFHDDDIFGSDNSGRDIDHPTFDDGVPNFTQENPLPNVAESGLHFGSDAAEHLSSSELSADFEVDLRPQQQRWLKKSMPISMIKELVKTDTVAASRKKSKKRNSRPVENGDEGPLLPGQTRVQKSANPKDRSVIKGDSESEPEIISDGNASSSSSGTVHLRLGPAHEGDSDSDAVEILESYRRPSPTRRRHQEIESLEDNYESEDTFDDEDIQDHFLPRENGEVNYLQETSLIDFMLTRSRNIGGPRKHHQPAGTAHSRPRDPNTSSKGSKTSSKYKFDITTRGGRPHGHTKQTLLNFHHDERAKKQRHRQASLPSNATSGPSRSRPHKSRHSSISYLLVDHPKSDQEVEYVDQFKLDGAVHKPFRRQHCPRPPSGSNNARAGPSLVRASRKTSTRKNSSTNYHNDHEIDDSDQVEAMDHGHHVPKMTWKEKDRARRKQARTNGIWCNPSDGQAIIGIARTFVTVAVEDEGFNLALIPETATKAQRDHWSNRFRPPPPRPQPERKSHRHDGNDHHQVVPHNHQSKASRDMSSDMQIPFLPAGKSFGNSTYIGRGWLYEMINVAAGSQDPVLPPSITLLNISLEPTLNVDQFCLMLPDITNSLFEFATGLPDPDHEILKTQWSVITHCASRLVSWYMKDAEEAKIVVLRETVEREVFRLAKQIEEFSFKFIDTPILSLCWFAIEIATRVGRCSPFQFTPTTITRPLKTAVTLLMNFLLRFKLQKTMKPLQKDLDLDGTLVEHYTAELWTRLIHLFNDPSPAQTPTKHKPHLFWSILLDVLQLRALKETLMSPFDASEDAWFTIFSLCALSQFSLHGMVAGQPRLPACWDAVVFALKRIRLAVIDTDSRDRIGQERDKYVALVTVRCMNLHKKWHWKLDNASAMFNALVDIFRSRKFANLFHEVEHCDVPEFMRLTNWDLLSTYNPKDTTYTVFLKLIVQAAREDPSHTPEKPSPRIKKLLSMAVPLGSISLSNETSDRDLSMFYNRLCAVAIAVDLDVNSCDERTIKARNYISFADVDPTMRFNVIRGLKCWAILLLSRGTKLDGMKDWIEQIAKILEIELRKFAPSEQSLINNADPTTKKEKARLVFLGNTLLASVRHIYEAHSAVGRYPEPTLIGALKPLLMSWILKHDNMRDQLGRLAEALFEARTILLPSPARPRLSVPLVEEESQESQDFGMDDFAGIDFDNLEALADPLKDKEEALRQALEYTGFKWKLVPFLTPCFQPPSPGVPRKLHERECDKWIRLWLCCGSVECHEDKWAACLRLLDMMLENNTTDEHWNRRVQLSIMYQVLKLEPMAYLSMTDRATQVFLFALVSDGTILEKEYVAFFLSIAGLHHPLLRHATCLPARAASGDYEFSSAVFSELRLALLQVIFNNLNTLVRKELEGSVDVLLDRQKYTDLCLEAFSKMRNTVLYIKDAQKLATYKEFCCRVMTAFCQNLELSMDRRFEFWVGWGRSLTDDPRS